MTQFGNFIEPKQKKVDRDAANEQTAYIRGNQPQPRQNENSPRDYDQNKVENGSGYNVDPFAVLRIHNATWADRTDGKFVNEGMRLGVESLGVKPSTEWDMVSVLQKSAPDGSFAQGVCSGPSPVFVLYRTRASLAYPFAIPLPEDSSKLIASPYGLNRILWHAPPSDHFQECSGEVLQTYINLGEDGQWVFWKLENDLPCCGSTTAKLCDLCGTVLQPDCPIIRTIYAPKGLNFCGCEDSCGTWKKDDIVPAWWYQYLEKWVTIPNFHANLEEKEMEVVTGLQITGGTIVPTEDFVTVVTGIVLDSEYMTLTGFTPQPVVCSGSIALTNAIASGQVSVTGNIGTSENPIQLDVVSACDDVTISGGSLTSTGNVTLSGSLAGSATVTVPLEGVSLPVTGTCTGTASGSVYVTGTSTVAGTCIITSTLPTLIVTGNVTVEGEATLSGSVTVGQNAITLTGSQKTFSKIASFTAPSLTLSNVSIPALTGTVTGTLSNATTTNVQIQNATITLDLSSIFEEVDAVDPSTFSFTGCTLNWNTKKVLALKSGASLSSVTASVSGTLPVPSTVTGTSTHSVQSGAYAVAAFSTGSLSWSDDTVTIPTTATLDGSKLTISGTGTMSTTGTVTGTATFPEGTTLTGTCTASGTCSASGTTALGVSGTISGTASGSTGATATGTASISDTITVSGPLNISSGVSLRGTLARDCPQYARGVLEGVTLSSTSAVSLPVTGTITDNRTCYVEVPTEVLFGAGAVTIESARVALPSVDLTGATISGTTATIKYVACADCPEPEEEEEE